MRIILTTNFSPWSPHSRGGQRATHNLAVALSEAGHRVTVVYTRAPGDEGDAAITTPYEVRWATLPGLRSGPENPLRPLSAVTVAGVVANVIGSGGVDAVHGSGEEAALLPAVRQRYRFVLVISPRFSSLPDSLLDKSSTSLWTRAKLAMTDAKYMALGEGLKRADWVCPTSRAASEMVRTAYGLRPSRIRVIPNGVGAPFTDVEWNPRSSSGPVVFFGRLEQPKGADTLLRALARLGDEAPPCSIIGRGEADKELEGLAASLGLADKVEFVSWLSQPELARRLAGASLAVLPSRTETSGDAMAEAMAVGVPLITSRVGSIPELVTHNETGLLVEPGDERALADAIARLGADPGHAAQLGRAAREHVHAKYSWASVAQSYESLYRRAPSQ